jgi:phosphatidylethanolamine-binding protein (PEBP) family uncharacterized protein
MLYTCARGAPNELRPVRLGLSRSDLHRHQPGLHRRRGRTGYTEAKPPAGTGTHRMFICVTALAVATLEVPADASRAMLNISLIPHTLGRAIIVGSSQPR